MSHPDPRWALPVQVAQLARSWRRAIDLTLRPYGLTEATWLPLLRLSRATAPMRQRDLADSLGLERSAVVRLLDRLSKSGFVTRMPTAGDRRSWTIVLTASGAALAQRVEEAAVRVRQETLSDIPSEDLAVTMRVIDNLCRRLDTAD